MAKREERLPFATFALIETDRQGVLRCQNIRARKKLHYRIGTNLCLQSDLSAHRMEPSFCENGYAIANFVSVRADACALVYCVGDDRLWWLFLEELQQDLLRDTLLCRPDGLRSLGNMLQHLTSHPDDTDLQSDISELLFAGLKAQSATQSAVTLVDAKSFLCGLFLPTLQSVGFHTKDTWQNEDLLRPLALSEYAMTLMHLTQMFATFAREIDFDLCADECGVFATLTPRRKKNRKTSHALARRLALDCAVVECCLQSQSCQIKWETAEEFTCRVYWCYDCHSVNYLGDNTDAIHVSLSCFQANLKELFSDLA